MARHQGGAGGQRQLVAIDDDGTVGDGQSDAGACGVVHQANVACACRHFFCEGGNQCVACRKVAAIFGVEGFEGRGQSVEAQFGEFVALAQVAPSAGVAARHHADTGLAAGGTGIWREGGGVDQP